jgi:type I restriction enzyme S subunit
LIINRVNSLTHLGKCLIIKDEYIPCLFESNMMKADMASQVKVEYLDYYIQSQFGRSRLIKNAKWAVNQASINQQDVKNMEITLPSYEEQSEIVRVATEKLDSIMRLETDIDVQLIKAKTNKQSILASAFSGGLS